MEDIDTPMQETEPSQNQSLKTLWYPVQGVDCIVDSSEKFDNESARLALTEMFMLDELPFKLAKRKRFRNFMSSMEPRFQLPSCIKLIKDCSRIYLDEKLKLKQLLSGVGSRICLSAKRWTSLGNLSYLCLTAHFVDEDWKLHRKILNFCPIAGGKGEEIGRIVESSVLDWGIRNVGTFTVENSLPNDVAVKYLKDKFRKQDYLLFGGEFFHVRCSANILNLIVRDCLEEMQTSVSRIRDAIKYVRSSTRRAEKFKRCIMKQQITSGSSSIVLDVKTRWSSTYFMLNSALNFQRAFEMLQGDDPEFVEHLNDEAPTGDDWNNARVLVKFLKIFYDASTTLSGSYVTSSVYFVEVYKILSALDKWTKNSEPHLQCMAVKMKESFDKYWGSIDEINLLLLVSIAFDPRCKVEGLRFLLGNVYPSESEKIDSLVNQIIDVMKKLFDYYNKIDESAETQYYSRFTDDMFRIIYKKSKEEAKRAAREAELQRYLENCEIIEVDDDDDFDILSWWKRYGHGKYYILTKIAKDLLSIPVSTWESKLACSFGDHTLGQFQSSLPPMIMESLVCTKSWLETSRPQVTFEEELEELEKLESVAKDLENAGTLLSPRE